MPLIKINFCGFTKTYKLFNFCMEIFSDFFPSFSFKMPSAKTNRVEPWAFRKPNLRESKRGDAESADANMCVQRAQSAVVMATPCGGSHLGCERARAAMQRPCCWRAQLSTHLQRRLLWSSVTWLKYRNKQEPQQAAASLSVRCLQAAGRSYDVRGDC